MTDGVFSAVASLKALYFQSGADKDDDAGAAEVEALEAAVLLQQPTCLEDAAAILDVVVDNMLFGLRSDELDIQAVRHIRDFLMAQAALDAGRPSQASL